jgi:hypothetical protein
LLAASGSGEADWSDTKGITTLQGLVKRTTERELCEECGISRNDVARTTVVAYARVGWRGAKPEFASISLLRVGSHDLNQAIYRRERAFETHFEYESATPVGGETAVSAFKRACREVRKENLARLSYSLDWALEVAIGLSDVTLAEILDSDGLLLSTPSTST